MSTQSLRFLSQSPKTRLFQIQQHHIPAVLQILQEQWDDIMLEADPAHTPETYLQYILDTYPNTYVFAYQDGVQAPVLASLVWVEYSTSITNRDIPAPVAYVHIVLSNNITSSNYARRFLHDLLGFLFASGLHTARLTGIRQKRIHRFLSKHPYGTLVWLPHCAYHPLFGVTDQWQWIATARDYAMITDKFEDEMERVPDGWHRRTESTGGTEDGGTSQRDKRTWKRKIQQWLLQLLSEERGPV